MAKCSVMTKDIHLDTANTKVKVLNTNTSRNMQKTNCVMASASGFVLHIRAAATISAFGTPMGMSTTAAPTPLIGSPFAFVFNLKQSAHRKVG